MTKGTQAQPPAIDPKAAPPAQSAPPHAPKTAPEADPTEPSAPIMRDWASI